jgi:hypothetical protein
MKLMELLLHDEKEKELVKTIIDFFENKTILSYIL